MCHCLSVLFSSCDTCCYLASGILGLCRLRMVSRLSLHLVHQLEHHLVWHVFPFHDCLQVFCLKTCSVRSESGATRLSTSTFCHSIASLRCTSSNSNIPTWSNSDNHVLFGQVRLWSRSCSRTDWFVEKFVICWTSAYAVEWSEHWVHISFHIRHYMCVWLPGNFHISYVHGFALSVSSAWLAEYCAVIIHQ